MRDYEVTVVAGGDVIRREERGELGEAKGG